MRIEVFLEQSQTEQMKSKEDEERSAGKTGRILGREDMGIRDKHEFHNGGSNHNI